MQASQQRTTQEGTAEKPSRVKRKTASRKEDAEVLSVLIANDDATINFDQLGLWLGLGRQRARELVDIDLAFAAIPITPKYRVVRVGDVKAWMQRQAAISAPARTRKPRGDA